MKKAGIIGGSEFIGSYIILKFLAEDYKVKIQISQKSKIKNDPFFKNISKNQNLEIHETDLINPEQIQNFIEDCELIIHCGDPIRLNLKAAETPIYAPVIKGTGNLFKAIQKCESLKKIIFISSTVGFTSDYTSTFNANGKDFFEIKNTQIEKAKFHATKSVFNVIDSFPDNFFEVIFISPIEIRNHQLSSSPDSTASGLHFLFRKKITPDPFFQRIFKRQVISGLTNIEDLPERVFNAAVIGTMNEALKTRNGQLTAHF